MFLFTETGYQLLRNRSRSLLLFCVSLLLCGCVALYVGIIAASRQSLNTLNETSPAVMHVVNFQGTARHKLMIDTMKYDVLSKSPVRQIRATARADVDPESPAGGASILGINCKEAAGYVSEEDFTFLEGYNSELFAGDEPLCLISEEYAAALGLAPGDQVNLPLRQIIYNALFAPVELPLGDVVLKVAGTAKKTGIEELQADIYLPVAFLRARTEEQGMSFYYDSFEAGLNDSMNLNEYKEFLVSAGFSHPVEPPEDPNVYVNFSDGNAVVMEDETFIKTAERLRSKLDQFEGFVIPFFVVVATLVGLSIFLVLRGARKDMAIACSLGRPKFISGLSALFAALTAEILGCIVALPVIWLAGGLSFSMSLAVCGAFLLCGLVGDIAALMLLLRFDTLRLLIETE